MTFYYMGDHTTKVLHDVPPLSKRLWLGGPMHGRLTSTNPDVIDDQYQANQVFTLFGSKQPIALFYAATMQQDVVRLLQSTRYAAVFGVDQITKI